MGKEFTADKDPEKGKSHQQLLSLGSAFIIWIIGALILISKGGQLLLESVQLSHILLWPFFSLMAGLALGALKSRLVFVPFCVRNIERIRALDNPRPWHSFTLKFWLLLILMIATGSLLSQSAHGNRILLNLVGAMDAMVGTGLLVSSICFFNSTEQ